MPKADDTNTISETLLITFAIVLTTDGTEIINASTEVAAFEALMGEPFPEDDLERLDALDWSCTIITMKPGERIDLNRYT